MKKRIYLANDLFSEATLTYNEMLYNELTNLGFEVYAPQKNTDINDKSKAADSTAIYDGDTDKLKWCDILVAVIDGPVIDPGVAAEIGWVAGYNEYVKTNSAAIAYGEDIGSSGKRILAIYSDSRDASTTANDAKNKMMVSGPAESQYSYANLYVIGAIKKYGKVFKSSKELFRYLALNER